MNKVRREIGNEIQAGLPKDAFVGTAEYYAQYRLPYPRPLLDDLRARAQVSGEGRLLDLASGPGRIALALAPHFSDVWAVDQEREMIEVGRERASDADITNVQWILSRAEDLEAPDRFFQLITIGDAFHRLDRQIVAERARHWLQPGRGLAILWYVNFWGRDGGWQQLVADVVEKWTGDRKGRRPTQGFHKMPFDKVLEASGFDNVAQYEWNLLHVWTLDALVGYMYSTSRVSRRVLGDRADPFEADLRRALLDFDAGGRYEETARFRYLFGNRPAS